MMIKLSASVTGTFLHEYGKQPALRYQCLHRQNSAGTPYKSVGRTNSKMGKFVLELVPPWTYMV